MYFIYCDECIFSAGANKFKPASCSSLRALEFKALRPNSTVTFLDRISVECVHTFKSRFLISPTVQAIMRHTSFVDVETVRRHLEANGHRVPSSGVASLLRDLGFRVAGSDPQNASPRTSQVSSPGPIQSNTILNETPSTGARQGQKITVDAPLYSFNKPSATTTTNIDALVSRLDALERQLQTISELQEHSGKLEQQQAQPFHGCTSFYRQMDGQTLPKCTSTKYVSPRCVLGDGATQLSDWAAGRWPFLHTSQWLLNNRNSDAATQHTAAKKMREKQTRTDPVARYR